MIAARAKQKRYFFEILWDEPKAKKQTLNKTAHKKNVVIAKKGDEAVKKGKDMENHNGVKPTRVRETPGNDELWE